MGSIYTPATSLKGSRKEELTLLVLRVINISQSDFVCVPQQEESYYLRSLGEDPRRVSQSRAHVPF